MNCFTALESQLIKIEVEESPSTIQCIICKDNFASRTERNEHLERHFIHRKCEHCEKAVIVIGDLEFELHRPSHCRRSIIDTCTTKLEPNILLGRLPHLSVTKTKIESPPITTITACIISEPESHDDFEDVNTLDNSDGDDKDELKCAPKIKNERTENRFSRKSRRKSRKINYNEDEDHTVNIKTESLSSFKVKNIAKHRMPNITKKSAKIEQTDQDDNCESGDDVPFEGMSFDDYIRSESNSEGDVSRGFEATRVTKKKKYPPNPKTLPCSECELLFRCERSVKIHKKQAHGIFDKLICPICNREFKAAGNLKQHINTHGESKRYICNYCGRGFHMPYNLKEHIHMHTGEKPYKCETCGKCFGRQTLKQAHTRMHTGEKPFKCREENCVRAYAYSSDLKRHKRSVHGIIGKTFECQICSKIFYENKFLTKHLNVHQGKM